MTDVRGKNVLVMGLGRFGGGTAVTRWLVEEGAAVTVTDQQSAETLAESVSQLHGLDVTLKLGGHDAADFAAADLVVASPAVPPTNEFLRTAQGGHDGNLPARRTAAHAADVRRHRDQGQKHDRDAAGDDAPRLAADRRRAGRAHPRPRQLRPAAALVDLTWDDQSTKSVGEEETLTTASPRRVWLGGNLGGSLLASLPQITAARLRRAGAVELHAALPRRKCGGRRTSRS